MTARRVLLRGAEVTLRAALDVCLVRFDVLGVREADGELEVSCESADQGEFERAIRSTLPADDLRLEFLPDPQAALTGLEHDFAIRVADRILVRPPWVPRPRDFPAGGTDLVVPRGGAFGSGEHGSTQAALLALDAAWPVDRAVDAFCDVGTGSGILALYAAVRGAGSVYGCDIDRAAVAAARSLVPTGVFELGGPAALRDRAVRADWIVANLTAAEHDASIESVVSLWTGRGPLVVSGMRVGEEVVATHARVFRVLGVSGAHARPAACHARSGFVASTFGPYTS